MLEAQPRRLACRYTRLLDAGARYAGRQSLEANMHFEKPENLVKATAEAVNLVDELGQFGVPKQPSSRIYKIFSERPA